MTQLSPGFALFSNHINDANAWVRAYMEEYAPEYLREVDAIVSAAGVMAIGTVPETPATAFYLGMICAAVNRDRDAE